MNEQKINEQNRDRYQRDEIIKAVFLNEWMNTNEWTQNELTKWTNQMSIVTKETK